jgi:outer membrane lipoprotein-sorting protein
VKRLGAWAVLMVLLAGCPHRPVEVHFGPEGEITDPRKMVDLLAQRDGAFSSLIGDARLHVDSAQGNGTVKQFVAIARPASLHIESFDFFGRPLSVLVSDGKEFSLYDAEKGEFYRGPATEQSIDRFLPISVPPAQIVSMMLGDVPRSAGAEPRLTIDPGSGRYVLLLQSADTLQTLEIGTEDLRILKSSLGGRYNTTLTHSDYRAAPAGDAFPHDIAFTDRGPPPLELRYHYSDIKLNTEIDPKLFHQEPPTAARVIDLDPSGNPLAGKPPQSPEVR